MSFVVYPHPMGMIPLEEIRQHTDQLFPEIMKAATQWKPTAKLAALKAPYPAERFKFTGTAGQVVIVETSTNLATWTPVATNTLAATPLYFSDPYSGNFPQRFYRLQNTTP